MSQTVISASGQSIGVAGQIADSMKAVDIVSAFNGDTSQMPFGIGCAQNGTTADSVRLPAGLSDTIVGVNVWSANHAPSAALSNGQQTGDLGASGLLPNASMQVGRKGRFLVPVEVTSLVPNVDRAFVRAVATGTQFAGAWSATANASYFIDLTKVAVFRSGPFTAADGVARLAVLDVDFDSKP